MKLSRKKTWTVPQMKSDPSLQYPSVTERHDDSEDADNYVNVVCLITLFSLKKRLISVQSRPLLASCKNVLNICHF